MVIKDVVKEVIPSELLDENTKYHINPTVVLLSVDLKGIVVLQVEKL